MEPMNRNMTMKKVAGFHSFDLVPFVRFSLRSGLGIRDVQNPESTMVAGLELASRTGVCRLTGFLAAKIGRPRHTIRVVHLGAAIVQLSILLRGP